MARAARGQGEEVVNGQTYIGRRSGLLVRLCVF